MATCARSRASVRTGPGARSHPSPVASIPGFCWIGLMPASRPSSRHASEPPGPADPAGRIRRAAHETAIHRVDAERACPAPVCPIDQDQALDGIDEVLTVFLSQGSRSPGLAAALPGRIRPPVLVAAAGQGWLVRITPAGVAVDGADPAAPAG